MGLVVWDLLFCFWFGVGTVVWLFVFRVCLFVCDFWICFGLYGLLILIWVLLVCCFVWLFAGFAFSLVVWLILFCVLLTVSWFLLAWLLNLLGGLVG